MKSYTLRPYQPGDEQAINDGFNRIFGHHRSLDEWAWKFPERERERSIMVACDRHQTILAHFAAQLSRLYFNSRTYLQGQGVDLYRDQDRKHVQGAVFVRLAHTFYRHMCGEDKIQFLYGMPGDRALRLGFHKLNFGPPTPVAYYEKTITRHGWRGLGARDSNPDDSAFDRLWQRCRQRYRVCTVRDSNYMWRRFRTHPRHRYQILTAFDGDHLRAWAVVRTEGGHLHWIDLLWDGVRERDLIALERKVVRQARRHNAFQLHLWLSNDDDATDLLKTYGWNQQPHPQHLGLVTISFHPDIDRDAMRTQMMVTMADSDLY